MRIRCTDGSRTLVDDTDYDLTIEEAVTALLEGKSIIAQPYAEYDSEDIGDVSPEAERLYASEFKGMSNDRIYEHLRMYARFGTY